MSEHDYEGKRISVESDTKTLGEALGSGAEGAVYQVESAPSEVVKIFEPGKRDEKADKVRAMIARPPTDPSYQHRDKRSIVWPTAVAEDPNTGAFLGYRMPYKDLSEQKNAQRYARENLQWSASSPNERYRTALNLARMFEAIHRQDHALGDMNHQNILIEEGGFVSLIDCDSFHIKGRGGVYPDDTVFPRYTPPEGRGKTLSKVRKSDRFGLGVHIFQLLMEGFHPYQAQGANAVSGSLGDMIDGNKFPYENPEPGKLEPHDQAPDYQQLPSELRDLFSKCFGAGGKKQGWRPSAEEWAGTLEEVTGLSKTDESSDESDDGDDDEDVSDIFNTGGGDSETTTDSDSGGGSGSGGSGNASGDDDSDGDTEDVDDIFRSGGGGGGSSTGSTSTTTADDDDEEDVDDIFHT